MVVRFLLVLVALGLLTAYAVAPFVGLDRQAVGECIRQIVGTIVAAVGTVFVLTMSR